MNRFLLLTGLVMGAFVLWEVRRTRKQLLMRISEVAVRINRNSDQLDAIAARIGVGGTDPEVPAELETALGRQDASIAALEAKVPPATPAP